MASAPGLIDLTRPTAASDLASFSQEQSHATQPPADPVEIEGVARSDSQTGHGVSTIEQSMTGLDGEEAGGEPPPSAQRERREAASNMDVDAPRWEGSTDESTGVLRGRVTAGAQQDRSGQAHSSTNTLAGAPGDPGAICFCANQRKPRCGVWKHRRSLLRTGISHQM